MTKTGWIIYRTEDVERNRAYIDWFKEECLNQQIELTFVSRESLTIGVYDNKLHVLLNGEACTIPDFAVIRTIESLLNRQFEQLGVHVFNSSEVSTICNNKAHTYQTIAQLGIPVTDTSFVSKDLLTEELPSPVPFVIKTVSGRAGNQVHMIKSAQEWQQFMVKEQTDDVVIQNCNVQLGKDLRVFVVGKEIVAAVLRESDNDFRANYSLGGNVRLYELSNTERSKVETIIDHFDFGMVGIDFLFGHDGNLLFNEIEDVVGSRMLSKTSDINIVEKYVTFIKSYL